jgi:hypothetical protein
MLLEICLLDLFLKFVKRNLAVVFVFQAAGIVLGK